MIIINGDNLSIEEVQKVCFDYTPVSIATDAYEKINQSSAYIERVLKENQIVYGITTGVGELANVLISAENTQEMQVNLLRSHAVGVGDAVPEEIARGMMLLRANALAKGFSGVRLELIQKLLDLLNHRIYPFIPSKGSVGSSGDLAPLSHLALVLIGEGECLCDGCRYPSLEILTQKNIQPIILQAKEGLALINGTQLMTAIGCLALSASELLLKNAQIIGAMSLEALRGTAKAFDARLHAVRPHAGQVRCAANMRRILEHSPNLQAHTHCQKVQDAYTLRCIPQVYGAVMDVIEYVRRVLAVEINSATDNPLIFVDSEEVISGGNFHGEPLAFAMDFLGIALSEIANISERTVDRLVNPHLSGLPAFLIKNQGLHSGMMIAQYTAAALVSENKIYAHPASVDSIPTSAGQEDHVSMGPISANHARNIIKNTEYVLAIELLCAAQGMDFLEHRTSKGTEIAHRLVRKHVSHLEKDGILYKDIDKLRELIVSETLVAAVESEIGSLD